MKNYKLWIIIFLIFFLFILAILFLFVIKEEKTPYCGDKICEDGETYENCPADCKSTEIEKGVKGTITLYQGSCMPPAGLECIVNKISTTVKIYELLDKAEFSDNYYQGKQSWYEDDKLVREDSCDCEITCEGIGSRSEGWYISCPGKVNELIGYTFCEKLEMPFKCKIEKKQPVAIVTSNQEGYYEIGLPNGQYSIVVEDPINEYKDYCNLFDEKHVCSITIANNLVEFNIQIDHAVW